MSSHCRCFTKGLICEVMHAPFNQKFYRFYFNFFFFSLTSFKWDTLGGKQSQGNTHTHTQRVSYIASTRSISRRQIGLQAEQKGFQTVHSAESVNCIGGTQPNWGSMRRLGYTHVHIYMSCWSCNNGYWFACGEC